MWELDTQAPWQRPIMEFGVDDRWRVSIERNMGVRGAAGEELYVGGGMNGTPRCAASTVAKSTSRCPKPSTSWTPVKALALGGAVVAIVVGCGSSGSARATAGNDLFSVAIPQDWHQTPVVGPSGGASFPDEGALRLVGPGNRAIQISWIDGPYTNGLTDQADNLVRNIPVNVDGQSTVVADYQTTDISGLHRRIGLLSGVSRTVHGRQVGFTATCQPSGVNDGDYSWCVDILNSWQWGSGSP